MNKKKKRLIIICAVLLALVIVLPAAVSVAAYESVFAARYTTDRALAYTLEDFPGLRAQRYEFPTADGQMLVGYRYYHEDQTPRAALVIAHGFGGGGHNTYMDCADFFAANGFAVFAYDATGNDESPGKGGGLPRGTVDLEHAIAFVESCEDFKDLPVVLFGHSWGGYSVCSVLTYRPEVKAVVSVAGFNRSSDLMLVQGREMAGGVIKLLMPYVNLWERIKFGGYATNTGMDGLRNSQARVMVIHSADDTVVPMAYGYEIYQRAYEESERFVFVPYEDRGHNAVFMSAAYRAYKDELGRDYRAYLVTEYPGYEKLSAAERQQIRYDWIQAHMDRERVSRGLDADLFAQILAFYESALTPAQ